MTNLKNIKIVAFDVGDTLHKFSHPAMLQKCYEAEIKVLRKAGLKFKTEDYYLAAERIWRESRKKKSEKDNLFVPKQILRYLGYPNKLFLAEKMGESFVKVSKKYNLKTKRTMPGAIDVVKYLHKKGYILGVISDTENLGPKEWLKEANIYHYFKIVVLSCEVGGRKASQKPFIAFKKLANKQFKVKPEEIVMVGNLSVDMDAKKQGFRTILFDPICQNTKHFLYQPDVKVKSLKDIKKYL
jgi:FMN phosphatase YigB (HAD superfamily)